MERTVTEAPQGLALSNLSRPFEFMLRDHRRWADTHGAEGAAMDLSGYDLRPVVSLAGQRLSALKAEKTMFIGLDMARIELQAAQLSGSDFRAARLHNADLRGVKATVCDFSGADMAGADLSPLMLTQGHSLPCDFSLSRLAHANLSGANLKRANLTDVDLTSANLVGANLTDADLRGATMDGANLDGARIEGAKFGKGIA
jgi:uncharacterized protein YjbI with pentapeptide repeats